MYKLVFIILLCFAIFITKGSNKPREYTVYKTEKSIVIDGRLDELTWQNAKWNEGFYMYFPYDNKSPSEETRFAILYDDDYVYVAIKAFDSDPSSISKRLTRRDELDGDYIGIQFDSYNDLQTAYGFSVSAAGTKRDMFISKDGSKRDESWDPIWWVKTSITDEGWEAEMKIPFSQLRFVNNYEQTWGVQVERYVYRHQETSLWNPKKRNDPGWVHHYGKMNGLVNIQPKKVCDFNPYIVGSFDSYEKEEGNPFADGSDFDGNIGLDGKIGLTNNLTLDFTVNPDFGQVEADPSTVNLSGFEQFFDEKRLFFNEGNNILNYSINYGRGRGSSENLFYSRRIGRRPHYYPFLSEGEYIKSSSFTRIIGAAKVTGRTENGLSIGILETLTAQERAKIQNSDGNNSYTTSEPLTNYAALSLNKDFGQGNTLLGGMITSTNRNINQDYLKNLHKSAYTGGITFAKYWKDKTWFIESRLSGSYVMGDSTAILSTQTSNTHRYQRPDADHLEVDSTLTSLSGYSALFAIGKSGGGNFNFSYSTAIKSPGYEINDIGYVMLVDNISNNLSVGYRINEPYLMFKNIGAFWNVSNSYEFSGLYLGARTGINTFSTFKNNFDMGIGLTYNTDRVLTSTLRGGPAYKVPGDFNKSIRIGTDNRKKVSLRLSASNTSGFEGNLNRNSFRLTLSVKPSENILVQLAPNYNTSMNEQQYVTYVEYDNDNKYILGKINQETFGMSIRLNYNINPEMSLQYWGQPFFASGSYSNFKFVTDPRNDNYTERFQSYTNNNSGEDQINFNEAGNTYEIDEDLNGEIDYTFLSPDFNRSEYLHNMVFRWEYRPGSTLFLVWSQNRNYFASDAGVAISQNIDEMFDYKPHNTFLVKFSYRIGI